MSWSEARTSHIGEMESQTLELGEFTRADDYRRKAEHLEWRPA